MFALKVDDVNFKAGSIRVDESSDQRTKGKLGPCKNAAAYRTVLMHDREGQEVLRILKRFIKIGDRVGNRSDRCGAVPWNRS